MRLKDEESKKYADNSGSLGANVIWAAERTSIVIRRDFYTIKLLY